MTVKDRGKGGSPESVQHSLDVGPKLIEVEIGTGSGLDVTGEDVLFPVSNELGTSVSWGF